MLLETLSTQLRKALTRNSYAGAFGTTPLNNDGTTGYTQTFDINEDAPSGEGSFQWGYLGDHGPNRILLIPFAEAAAGANFSFRIYSWRELSWPSGATVVDEWIPLFLAEFACTTCNRAGAAADTPSVSTNTLLDSERVCDTITLTQGSLGTGPSGSGFINSTGPGTDLVAYAFVDVGGARFVSFDFQQIDPVGMNCLWARA